MLNRLIRMVMNFAMREGVDHGSRFLAERRARKLDPNSPEAKMIKQNSRKQSQMMRRSLRIMRRFFRF